VSPDFDEPGNAGWPVLTI